MPAAIEPPQRVARRQDRQYSARHRGLRLFLRALIVILIGAFLAGSWYLAKRGFGRQSRLRIIAELHKQGIEASIRRLTLDPFRGLIAKDVRLFDFEHREKTLAVISEVALDLNYAALLQHQPFLNALDVRDADLTFVIPHSLENAPPVKLNKFRGHVYFSPGQIYVSQAEGIFCGLQISARGQLIQRPNYTPQTETSAEEWRARLALLQRFVTEISQFKFPGEPPRIELHFSGDLAELEKARVEATLRGGRVRRGAYELHDLFATAEWDEQKLNLNQFGWSDARGSFSARGTWQRENRRADFEARSSLDLKTLLEAFGSSETLRDAEFSATPHLDLSGTVDLGGAKRHVAVIGTFGLENFRYKSVPFLRSSADFSWDGERVMFRNISVRAESGQLSADVLDAPQNFRVNIESSINPVLFGVFAPSMRQFLGEWEWSQPPNIRLAIRGTSRDPNTWSGDGTIALQRTRFRGVPMKSANADVHFGGGAITYDNFHVVRDEGAGAGSFTYDFAKREVRFSNVRSTLRPLDAIVWIDPTLLNTIAPYKFRKPPDVSANGVYQFGDGKNTRININVDGAGGMDYVFLGKTLPCDRVTGKLIFTNDRLQIVDLNAALFSGKIRGDADISLAKNEPRYHASISANGVDFPRLTDLYFQYQTAHGRFAGQYDFTGLGSDARSMQGSGNARISEGDVFSIPVFGPLSESLAKMIPGAGYSVAHQADVDFTIKDGVIHTENLTVAGKLFSMIGRGDLHFLDDKLDLDVGIKPKGAGVLLTPMYKLFEYKGEGSLLHPNWHPKRF